MKNNFHIDSYRKYLCRDDTRHVQLLSGLLSLLAGILFAGTLLYFLPENTSSVEKARELGMISKTVLDGYPKAMEIPYYVMGVSSALFFGLLVFFLLTYLFSGKRTVHHDLADESSAISEDPPKLPLGPVRWAFVALALFIATFHFGFIYKNWYWGPWTFFFEEGAYLRWINELFRGKILYKDIYLSYGPLMIWPQYLLMRLLGPSVALHRTYIYVCYLIGYLIVFKTLRDLVNGKWFLLAGMLLVLYFYYPMFPGVHVSLGRFTLCFIPLLFLHRFFQTKQPGILVWAGIFLGIALLFSQELGVASSGGVMAMLTVFHYREGGISKSLLREVVVLFLGLLIPTVPVLIYFGYHRALPGFYEAMVMLTGYYSKGAWGLPFPNLFDILRAPGKSLYGVTETVLAYWPIVFYLGSALFCLILFARKSFTNRTILAFGITVVGFITLMRAFGVYSLMQIKSGFCPLMVLGMYYLDMAWSRFPDSAKNVRAPSAKAAILSFVILVLFLAGGLFHYARGRGSYPGKPAFSYRADLKNRNDYCALKMQRAEGIQIPLEFALTTESVVEFIKTNTRPDDPIYVFPYAPIYYFLANRPSATKYAPIYAVVKTTREGTLHDLRKARPIYVIYVGDKAIFGLTHEMRFPEIVRYIEENYRPVRKFDDTTLLKRKDLM